MDRTTLLDAVAANPGADAGELAEILDIDVNAIEEQLERAEADDDIMETDDRHWVVRRAATPTTSTTTKRYSLPLFLQHLAN
jgi:predicted ArsR family transcriptional regulator